MWRQEECEALLGLQSHVWGKVFPGRFKNLLAHKYLFWGVQRPRMPSVLLVSPEWGVCRSTIKSLLSSLNDLSQRVNLLQWTSKAEIYMPVYCFLRVQACDFVWFYTHISIHTLFKWFSKTKWTRKHVFKVSLSHYRDWICGSNFTEFMASFFFSSEYEKLFSLWCFFVF